MTSEKDTKEWVTIKVPKKVRDAAQDDPRTYGDVIRAGLEGESDTDTDTQDVDALVDAIAQEIDTAAFNGGISDEQAERILGRLDDLEHTIPRKTVEELR